jgi:hypothetical protein
MAFRISGSSSTIKMDFPSNDAIKGFRLRFELTAFLLAGGPAARLRVVLGPSSMSIALPESGCKRATVGHSPSVAFPIGCAADRG